jgi:ABC-2 type transport system permease protein
LRGTDIILRRDFGEFRQTNTFRILVIISALVTVAAAAGISLALRMQPWLGAAEAIPVLELIIGSIAYFMPLIVLIAFIWAFASLPVTREKIGGNIECLLATPLSPRVLWLGKSLAIFLPGYVISLIATLIVLLAVNIVAIVPATGGFMLPAAALLAGLLFDPLLFLGLAAFTILFSLANNPDIAIAPSFVLGFGLMMAIPLGMVTGVLDLASWSFALWYLAGDVVAWIIIWYLSRMLTREKIVLSSKGD